jgi:hypothetical protein
LSSCRRVQSDAPSLVPQKALRRQGQALVGDVAGSDIFALEAAGSIPPASGAVGGRGMLAASASPPLNPTPSARAALLEVEVEKSI